MPWEKSFDEQDAVTKAMKVFWRKGYEVTSINDLIKSTGINRGSLYNAFGGKHPLFIRSLLKYDQENRKAILAELESLNNPTLAFKALFNGMIEEAVNDPEKKGCFVVNTSLEFASHKKDAQDIVTQSFQAIEAFFRRGIEVSQARGEMPQALEPATTAKVLLALVVSIRVLGRGAFDVAALYAIAHQAESITSL